MYRGLAAILEFIRPRDELVAVKLDRLRSTRDVLNLVHEIEQTGAGLRVLEPEFCNRTEAKSPIGGLRHRTALSSRSPKQSIETVRKMHGIGPQGPLRVRGWVGWPWSPPDSTRHRVMSSVRPRRFL
jgi:Resolvase, N terminal domain